jgi:hypothetical protein
MAVKSTAKWADDDWVDYAVAELAPVFDVLDETESPWELLAFESTPLSALLCVEYPGIYVGGFRIKKHVEHDRRIGCTIYYNNLKFRSHGLTPGDETANKRFLQAVRSSLSANKNENARRMEEPHTAGAR